MSTAHKPNAQYNVADPSSLPVRIAAQARRRMYEHFVKKTSIQPAETLLDVGVTSDQSYESSNYVEAWYPHKDRVTAVGLDDAAFLEQRYPGLTYRRADGRSLPFADDSFDVVHSSAVLEHVGSADNQRAFITELTRVAKRVVFLTTPNRWFPVEFHSVLPLVHWLPRPWFRRVLRGTRYSFFSEEDNLNLLSRNDILRLCRDLRYCSLAVESLRTFGMSSNLLVTIEKRPNGVSDS
jgi:methyltransferase family protein